VDSLAARDPIRGSLERASQREPLEKNTSKLKGHP
jgi:hypothetical protein